MITRSFLPAMLALGLIGCSTAPTLPAGMPDLSADIPHFGGDRPTMPPAHFLAVDDAMRAFVRTRTGGVTSPRKKLDRLMNGLFGEGDFSLRYDVDASLTASQTFHRRSGNCLSTTALLVALAREAGLEAAFQDVDERLRTRLDDTLWIHDKHVNAVVQVGRGKLATVDFDRRAEGSGDAQRIDDNVAAAQFFSNLGASAMRQDEPALAHANFRQALALAPQLGYVWNNTGVLYWREGLLEQAEEIFLYAIKLQPDEYRAMSNLAGLYHQTDRAPQARALEARLEAARRGDPYYIYSLANRAYEAGEYEKAAAYLHDAIARKNDEPAFRTLLKKAEARQLARDSTR